MKKQNEFASRLDKVVKLWLNERCYTDGLLSTTLTMALFADFRSWYKSDISSVTIRAFGDALNRAGFARCKAGDGKIKRIGITLKPVRS